MEFTKSKALQAFLREKGIEKYEDLLDILPRTYMDLHPTELIEFKDKQKVVVEGKLVSTPTMVKHQKLTIIRFCFVSNQNQFYNIVAYNRPYLMKQLKLGENYVIVGTYDYPKRVINMVSMIFGEIKDEDRIRPIYSLPADVENYQFVRLLKKAFALPLHIEEYVPSSLQEKYRLLDKKQAYYQIHFPKTREEIHQGYRTLKYEECLLFSLKTQWIRLQNKALENEKKEKIDLMGINDFVRHLPYKLTKDQLNAVREIILDMNCPTLMYRLIQGDVGTGKTLVAAIALYGNYLRNDQGAFMAPTDALARQHYQNFIELFKDTPVKIGLLVGALTNKEKQEIKDELKEGNIDILIGTHALFSEDVFYPSLGLAVIDEQHRFGVNQRNLLASKGPRADLLLMSATPIPRTLALTLYGDLDITTIQTFPFKKRDIVTKVLPSDAEILAIKIKEMLDARRQIYVIAPLIEENEGQATSVLQLYEEYENHYPGMVGLLHGKLSQEEKEEVLQEFQEGEKLILISTTVVEVGIDVKTASLMLIYNANQFGLASLHQLRGRIGRDGEKAYCFLLYDGEEEEEKEKLQVLEKTEDGFVVAEEDLKRRGPGELVGVKQSGLPDFRYVNFIQDFKMMEVARADALEIIRHPKKEENQAIFQKMLQEVDDPKR